MAPELRRIALSLLLTCGVGCGSEVIVFSDDDGPSTTTTTSGMGSASSGTAGGSGIETGQLGGLPVGGVSFETDTLSGETTLSGEFQYRPGESVRFRVGDLVLGEAPGAQRVSLFDLAGITPPTTAREIRHVTNRLRSNARGIPFDRVINLSVFLQTLDADADPTNGISIPFETHEVAMGRALDFEKKYASFVSSFALREFVGAARALQVWTHPNPVRVPYLALDATYAGLGIAPTVATRMAFEEDLGTNGFVNQRRTYHHNAVGQLSAMSSESFYSDHSVVTTVEYEFDEHGHQVLLTGVDWQGNVSSTLVQTYDSDGNLSRRVIENYGTFERSDEYTYDQNGSPLTLEVTTKNGSYRETYAYDASGHRTLLERFVGFDTPAVYRESFTYDVHGHLQLKEVDNQADGTVDSRERYAYSVEGDLLSFETLNADGEATFRETYAYDSAGNQILFERAPHADEVKARQTFAYDSEGNQILIEQGGINNVNHRTVHTYDAIGTLVASEFQNVNHPHSSVTHVYTTDADGNVTARVSHASNYTTTYRFSYEMRNRWAPAFENRW